MEGGIWLILVSSTLGVSSYGGKILNWSTPTLRMLWLCMDWFMQLPIYQVTHKICRRIQFALDKKYYKLRITYKLKYSQPRSINCYHRLEYYAVFNWKLQQNVNFSIYVYYTIYIISYNVCNNIPVNLRPSCWGKLCLCWAFNFLYKFFYQKIIQYGAANISQMLLNGQLLSSDMFI